jgi:molecular chaperone GrpE
MSDRPQTVDRSQGAAEEQRDSSQPPRSPDAAQAPQGDGRGAPPAPGAPQAAEPQVAEPRSHVADEDALRGDVDELVAVAAQRDEYLALAQRTQADFENYRKRVAKESVAAQERGMARLAQELLPALDNLDRALEEGAAAAERAGGDAPLLEGVRLVRSELHAALARMGIECFSPVGATFDPSEHEAMAQRPAPDAQSGTVVEVFQPGYRIGKHIIRPARVLVAA